jgi:hypothetical protein
VNWRPRVRRVFTLYDSRDAPRQAAAAARAAATMLSITLVEREVRSADKISHGPRALDEADTVLGVPGCVTSGHHETMIAASNSQRLPSVFYTRTRTTRNALLTYGADDVDVARDAARLVDKILKGANAGDLTGRPKATEKSRAGSGCGRASTSVSFALVRPIETDPLALRPFTLRTRLAARSSWPRHCCGRALGRVMVASLVLPFLLCLALNVSTMWSDVAVYTAPSSASVRSSPVCICMSRKRSTAARRSCRQSLRRPTERYQRPRPRWQRATSGRIPSSSARPTT